MDDEIEKEVKQQLDLLDAEISSAVQAYYIYKTIHVKASDNPVSYRKLSENGFFWATVLYALQCSFIIALGRIFDNDGRTFNVNKFINFCHKHKEIFSKANLAQRKIKDLPGIELSKCLEDAYEISDSDFRDMKKRLKLIRNKYESKYEDIRNKVFAHKELQAIQQINGLFSVTSIDELEEMLNYLASFESAIRILYLNGQKPNFDNYSFNLKDKVVKDTEKLLNLLLK